MMERGIIEQINTRGRVTLRLPDRVVVADLNNGSGGCVGDTIEGDMQPGLQSWRNVGNGILSVVRIVAVRALADNDDAVGGGAIAPGHNPANRDAAGTRPTAARGVEHQDRTGDATAQAAHAADQNSRRKRS